MKEQWIQQMQQKLAGYRQPAPEVSWDEIEKALANNRQKAKAKMVQIWTRRIAAAVVVLVAVTTGYMAMDRHEKPSPQQKKEKIGTKEYDVSHCGPYPVNPSRSCCLSATNHSWCRRQFCSQSLSLRRKYRTRKRRLLFCRRKNPPFSRRKNLQSLRGKILLPKL